MFWIGIILIIVALILISDRFSDNKETEKLSDSDNLESEPSIKTYPLKTHIN